MQLQCSHRSLLAQLLSPATNRRRDKYGRGPHGRLRALLDTVAAVRKETAARTEPFKGDAELMPLK